MTMANYKTRVSLLAISLVFALAAIVPLTTAKAGATSVCAPGYELLNKYEYDDGQYEKDDNLGTNVTVTGNGYGGTFTVVNQKKLVYSVKVESDSKSKVDSYSAGVSSGTFNNSGLYSQKIEKLYFCGKDVYYFQFDKVWKGDEIDQEKVSVTFNIGKTVWSLGDKPVQVKPGETLSPLSEDVTGLPEGCTYTSDLEESYTPFPEYGNNYRSVAVDNGPRIDTLTVTNTVTCEDEGEVLGTTTATTTPKTTTVASLPNTGSKVAAVAAILTAITTGAAMFSTTLRSALVKFTN